MKLAIAVIAAAASQAAAKPVELGVVAKQCGGAVPRNEAVGEVVRAATIGTRPATEILEIFGTKARAYLVADPGGACVLVPVVGKPAWTKGSFGGGATVAYGLTATGCDSGMCPTVISLKTADDKLVDALFLGFDYIATDLDHARVFADHDSILAHAFSSGGADIGRSDLLLELVGGKLTRVAEAFGGIAWHQEEEGNQRCDAVPPGRIDIVVKSAQPVLDLIYVPYDDEAKIKGAPDWQSGGCEQTVVHQRATWDAKRHTFVAAAKLTYAVAHKICRCQPN